MIFDDTRHVCDYVSKELSRAQQLELRQIFRLLETCVDLQTVYDDVVDSFLETVDPLISGVFVWPDAKQEAEPDNSWILRKVSCLSSIWSALETAKTTYEKLLSVPAVAERIGIPLNILRDRLQRIQYHKYVSDLSIRRSDSMTTEVAMLHLVLRITSVRPFADMQIYENVNARLSFDSPMLSTYLAAACLRDERLNKMHSVTQTEEQYAVMKMFDQFHFLPGMEWG